MKEYPQCKHDIETLRRLQALPLREKIFESRLRIAEWVKYWGEDKVYISFSGGKDSTVQLDLVRRDYPDIPAVFFDTGLEFPEIRDFVKTIENVIWRRPKMTFKEVIETYGFPVVSKEQAQYIRQYQRTKSESVRQLREFGIRKDGSIRTMGRISKKWMKLAKQKRIMVSEKCCDALKKRPARDFEKETGWKPFYGTMAAESHLRQTNYERLGCNAYEGKRPRSAPMMFWGDADVWEYIRMRDLPYSPIYDMGYVRTGCMFCAFGAHLEKAPNRFQRMEKTHPKQWNYCVNKLGMKEALDLINVPYKYQPELFDEL